MCELALWLVASSSKSLLEFRTADQIRYLPMQLRIGYELIYSFPRSSPIILVVKIHDSRTSHMVVPHSLPIQPPIPVTCYRDTFGNQCHRVFAPAGRLRLTADGVIRDNGKPDEVMT